MGILDDVLKTTPAQEFLDQQSPAVRDALAEGLGLPDDPRITGYRPFQPPVPGVPGKAPRPLSGATLDDLFASDAPPAAQNPQASRYQPKLAQFANQMQYRMPMQGLGSIMMRRR
jgi:hypothetical protein